MREKMTRHPDHSTSHEAADRIDTTVLQAEVLMVLDRSTKGLTDEQLRFHKRFKKRNFAESTVRKRRTELTQKGVVVWSGAKKKNNLGNNQKVWQLKKHHDA